MEKFNPKDFARSLKSGIYELMPYENEVVKAIKHKSTPLHIRDVSLGANTIIPIGMKSVYFEIGNNYAENLYPYYHILEDSEVITKKDKNTKNKKLLYSKINDYGIWEKYVDKNGEIKHRQPFRPRFRKKLWEKATYTDSNGIRHNSWSKYYRNIHYHYIENILDNSPLLSTIATTYGLKRRKRKIFDNSPLANEIKE